MYFSRFDELGFGFSESGLNCNVIQLEMVVECLPQQMHRGRVVWLPIIGEYYVHNLTN